MNQSGSSVRTSRELDQLLAAPMFALSLVVLALFAALLSMNDLDWSPIIFQSALIGLALTYPVFWLETIAHLYLGSDHCKQHIWFCVIPITRIGMRDHTTGSKIWLPFSGWKTISRRLERKLIRTFSIPMIVIALMVLPIIALEFFYQDFVNAHDGGRLAIKVTEAFIWAAFTFEFTLMVWIVKYPLTYAKKHWIDLAIILLPTLAFLRTMRLAYIGRLKQLSRTARVYRLRGLAMRCWRAFVALEIVEMLLYRDPERRLEKLEGQLEDKLEELAFLRKDIQRLKKRVEDKRQAEAEEEEEDEKKEARQDPEVPADDVADEPVPTEPSDHHSDSGEKSVPDVA